MAYDPAEFGECGECGAYIGGATSCPRWCLHSTHRLPTPAQVQAARRAALMPPVDIAPERLCEAPETLEGDVPTCILAADHDGRHVVVRARSGGRGHPSSFLLYRLDEAGPALVYESSAVRWPITRRGVASLMEFHPGGLGALQG